LAKGLVGRRVWLGAVENLAPVPKLMPVAASLLV
jgi:hypothetical protein